MSFSKTRSRCSPSEDGHRELIIPDDSDGLGSMRRKHPITSQDEELRFDISGKNRSTTFTREAAVNITLILIEDEPKTQSGKIYDTDDVGETTYRSEYLKPSCDCIKSKGQNHKVDPCSAQETFTESTPIKNWRIKAKPKLRRRLSVWFFSYEFSRENCERRDRHDARQKK